MSNPTPATPEQNEARDWLVWSFEHRAWWGPENRGYTNNLLWAGLYTKSEADDISELRGPVKKEEPRHIAHALQAERERTPYTGRSVFDLVTLASPTPVGDREQEIREASETVRGIDIDLLTLKECEAIDVLEAAALRSLPTLPEDAAGNPDTEVTTLIADFMAQRDVPDAVRARVCAKLNAQAYRIRDLEKLPVSRPDEMPDFETRNLTNADFLKDVAEVISGERQIAHPQAFAARLRIMAEDCERHARKVSTATQSEAPPRIAATIEHHKKGYGDISAAFDYLADRLAAAEREIDKLRANLQKQFLYGAKRDTEIAELKSQLSAAQEDSSKLWSIFGHMEAGAYEMAWRDLKAYADAKSSVSAPQETP